MAVLFYNAVFGISCYYMVASFTFRYLDGLLHRTDPYAFGLLVAAALLLAFGRSGLGRKHFRALPVAALCLPALAFIWNHGLLGILEFMPPWMYLGYLWYRRPRPLSHYYFKQDFMHFLWIFVLMTLFLFASPGRGVMALQEAVPYIVIFLTAGVSLLQALRHKQEEVKGFAWNQGKRTSIFFLFSILLTAGGFLEFLEEFLLHRFLLPAVLFFSGRFLELTRSVRDFLEGKLWKLQKDYGDFLEDVEGQRHGMGEPEYDPEPILTKPANQPIGRGEINEMFVAVLVAVVAAVVLFIVFYNSRKKNVQEAFVLDEREALPEPADIPGWKRGKDTPQEGIRKRYQKFMQVTDGKSGRLNVQDTTKEIREKYLEGREDGKAAEFAEELTEIYRLARYHEQEGAVEGMDMAQKARRMKILLDYLKKV